MLRFANLALLLMVATVVFANPLGRNCTITEPDSEGKVIETCYVYGVAQNRTETRIYRPDSINIQGPPTPKDTTKNLREAANGFFRPINSDVQETIKKNSFEDYLADFDAAMQDLKNTLYTIPYDIPTGIYVGTSGPPNKNYKAAKSSGFAAAMQDLKNTNDFPIGIFFNTSGPSNNIYEAANSDTHETSNNWQLRPIVLPDPVNVKNMYDAADFYAKGEETPNNFYSNTHTNLQDNNSASTLGSLNFLLLIFTTFIF